MSWKIRSRRISLNKSYMVARIWHGRTKSEDLIEYSQFMNEVAIPDYKKTPGFVKLTFLRRVENNVAHFTLITYWESLDVIKNFAGNDSEKAKYYPKDSDYLLEFEEKVVHYDVFAEAQL